ncbi:MAG TPA: uracil phosphoribosyltransferase [bacterium]|nr:uracil phosphoribosyltransferase [bacterium]HQG44449.1 uracil phosphoribosyltransferase [bacterium]HQI47536.1 uracil phosphoribosyltransferase [bacterium]HQJ63112.1 uracil phosphoribosyltransferase [bacterium]
MENVHLIHHPVLAHSLTLLRDRRTGTEEFRRHAAIVAQIVLLEATRTLPVKKKTVRTPLASIQGGQLTEDLVLVPVLRAGLSLLNAALDILPGTPVGFIGLERDERTALARTYYQKFPLELKHKHVIVLDPMLATGGSLIDTVARLYDRGVQDICAACVVAAPEGIAALHKSYTEVLIYTAAIDSHLDETKYIVPGLGDFGDRYFGT